MTTAATLLKDLAARGVRVEAAGDRLRFHPRSAVTDDLLARLRDHKAELLRLLAGGSGDPPDPRDGAPVIDPHAPTCPACGSARIAHGLRRLWCIDCETDAGPAGDPQDLPEGGGAMVADDRQDHAHGSAAVPIEWPAAAADFCLRLAPDDLPQVPFRLNDWTTVSDAARFLRSLQADIKRGPSGPRAFYGALQNELIELQQFAHRGQKGR